MRFFIKNKFSIVLIVLLAILYFGFRLPNLTVQPIFADEAIYIRWAQVMRAEPTLRFLPLTDGKTPLFMWVLIPFLKFFDDPLLAGRFLSIMSGFLTFLGVIFLGWRFFNRRVGLWAAFLIAVTPYMFFFDRMALVDSMLSAFSIWSLIFALLLVYYPRLDLAMFLGYFLGGGLLVKTSGIFNILVLPVTCFLINWRDRLRQKKVLRLFGFWLVAFLISMIIYNILRLGPGFSNLSSRNQDYVHSPSRFLIYPLDPFWPHLKDLVDWLPKLLTIPILMLSIGSLLTVFFTKNRLGITILFWSVIPLIAQMFLLKTFTARYLLFSIGPILVLSAYFLDLLIDNFKKAPYFVSSTLVIGILLVQALYFNISLFTNPQIAPLPSVERKGYLEDWTAGYGFEEIAAYLDEKSKGGLVIVGTEGYFGTLPDGLQIYLDKNKNVIFMPGLKADTSRLKEEAYKHPTYFVANKSRLFAVPAGLKLIKEYPKAIGDVVPDAIYFFEVLKK